MEQEGKFLESLEELKNIAATQNNQLTLEDIRQYFSDFAADDTKMELIYQYFVSSQIKIVGKEDMILESEEEEIVLDEKAEKVLQMYMEEIGDIRELSVEEEKELVEQMLDGDEMAKVTLIESKLKLVADVAKNYQNRGLLLGDLIQEGNIGLLQGVEEYDAKVKLSFHEFSKKAIRDAIEKAIRLQKDNQAVDKKIANKVNELDEAAQDLARELGKEATPLELAKYMHITEEEVRELMKISLDAISVVEPNMQMPK
ncbi:MAG: sigma-70 family RNA polymerase sigma factor [Lachnospiraceae bacterium]